MEIKASLRNSITSIILILGIFLTACGLTIQFYPAYAGEFKVPKPPEEVKPLEEKEEPEEKPPTGKEKGGCLIATATYGSELAPQVQMLREIRDSTLLKTPSGATFMTGFNSVYYTFSPTVAEWERQNPVFKETVKIAITPLLISLTLLNAVDIDSEAEMLAYGIGIILANIGIYFGIPVFTALGFRRIRKCKMET